jgi:alpha-tubulin suppressor-like RCC1 family protein
VQRLKSDVRVIEAGSRHTIMATSQGRCYTWGENDEMQLGTDQTEETMAVFRVLKGEERLRRIACGDDHGIILTKHKTCFTFGKNDIGQLGLGDSKIHERIILNETLTRSKLKGVYAKGDESYGVTGDGKVLFWPTSPTDPSIGRLKLPNQQQAKMMALGHNFVLILTEKGYLYSFGQDNSSGQLGLGHVNPVVKPTWIDSIEKERITSISCGKAHCLALTKNSKIYSWGQGTDGQLGLGLTDNFLYPTQVDLDQISSRVI